MIREIDLMDHPTTVPDEAPARSVGRINVEYMLEDGTGDDEIKSLASDRLDRPLHRNPVHVVNRRPRDLTVRPDAALHPAAGPRPLPSRESRKKPPLIA